MATIQILIIIVFCIILDFGSNHMKATQILLTIMAFLIALALGFNHMAAVKIVLTINVFFLTLVFSSYIIRYYLGNIPKFRVKEIIYRKKFKKLFEASSSCDLQALLELHASGFNINEHDHMALDNAAWKGSLPIVKLCVENGASIEAKQHALCSASFGGYSQICEYLIDNGVNPRAFKDYALILSASNQHFELAQYFIGRGCDPCNILNHDPKGFSREHGILIGGFTQNFKRSKEWAQKIINIKEMAEKLDRELEPKTTTKSARMKI